MPKKLTAYYVTNEDIFSDNAPRKVEITDALDTFYEMLDCRTIDIVNREIDGKRYDIICDDEGLLRADPVVSAYDDHFNPMLVGKLLIVGEADKDGNLTSLTDEDVRRLELSTSKFGFIYCTY